MQLVHVQNFFCSFNNTSWLLQIVHTGILILFPSYGDVFLFYFLSVGVLCVSPASANSCHAWSRQQQRLADGWEAVGNSASEALVVAMRCANAVWEEIESIHAHVTSKMRFCFSSRSSALSPTKLAMSSLMDILYHPSPMKESKNSEIVGIWGLGCSLDTNPSSFLSRCTQNFR
jgi:hypothetical protein